MIGYNLYASIKPADIKKMINKVVKGLLEQIETHSPEEMVIMFWRV